MTQRQQETSIDIAARQTGLETRTVRRCVQVGRVSGLSQRMISLNSGEYAGSPS
jgi:hypothetical protein